MNDNHPEIPEVDVGFDNPGTFITFVMNINEETGEVEGGIAGLPIDLNFVVRFQAELGDELAKENIKFVIVGKKAFLAPVQVSSLIIPK
jgi:hypothetical protein